MTGRQYTPSPSEAVARHLVQLGQEAEPHSWETNEPPLDAAKRVWSASVNDLGSGEEHSVRRLFRCQMHTIENVRQGNEDGEEANRRRP